MLFWRAVGGLLVCERSSVTLADVTFMHNNFTGWDFCCTFAAAKFMTYIHGDGRAVFPGKLMI